jgi:5-methylcytosine-specific restriction endonuclease McrA
MSNRPTIAQREQISKLAKGLCEYCQSQENYSNSTFEVEHIFPVSKGGKTVLENLAYSCSGCNKYKSHRISVFDKATKTDVFFYNPRKDSWNKHFVWNEDFTEIVGSTAQGRVTITALKLNRPQVVNLRKLLSIVGEHPPNLD